MKPHRDYLGVWPDIGNPPDTPFPHTCPRTRRLLSTSHVRYLEWTGEFWQIPVDTPPAPEYGTVEVPRHVFRWATELPAEASRTSKVLAAKALYTGVTEDVDRHLESMATGRYLGEVGQRLEADAVVVSVTRQPDHPEYGPQYRVGLTLNGEEAVWWAGESCWCDAGDTCRVRFTVKRHSVFNGRRVTTVNRVQLAKGCEVVRDAGLAPEAVQCGQADEVSNVGGP